MAFLFQDQNQGTRTTTQAHAKIALAAATVLFHPDCNRRLRNCTESADPSPDFTEEGARGLGLIALYRRWGFSPRPENIGTPGMDEPETKYDQTATAGQAPLAWGNGMSP